jgi:nicotinate-nucleotide adenylyltransferase
MIDTTARGRTLSTAMIGGSFDPVHLGHLHLIHCVVEHTDYQRIILVPVALNNFKQDEQRPASAVDRLAMLRLAIGQYREIYPQDREFELAVDSCELERGGVSYTYDTVRYIYEAYPVDGSIAVVVGDDLLDGLSRWHRFSELKEIVTFIVCRRETVASIAGMPDGVTVRYIDNAVKEDSSTDIRRRLSELPSDGDFPMDVASLMPGKVAEYVQERHLYRT